MGSEAPKPVLWLSLTSEGRHSSEGSLAEVAEDVQEAVGDDYHVIAADDKVRLLDEAEIKELIDGLQGHAAQFAHEDAMAEAIEGQQEGEE